jgi:anti-sigma factor RsiW
MTCADRLEAISAHLDGEPPDAESAELEAHLASCAGCCRQADGLRALKHAVARLEGRAVPPEPIQARVEALRLRRQPAWKRFGFAGAAAVLAAAVAVLVVSRPWAPSGEVHSLPSDLIADHLRSAPDVMPAEIASSDRLEVARFFRSKVPFDPVVPALGSAKLVGGRVCKIEGRKVQLLFYEFGDRHVSLYVSDRPPSMERCHDDGEHSVCHRQLAGLSVMLVGRGSKTEVGRLLDEATL